MRFTLTALQSQLEEVTRSDGLSSPRRSLVVVCPRVEPRRVGLALAEGMCGLGGGHHFGWRPPWLGERGPCFFSVSYTLAFASQPRKRTENLSQGTQVVLDTDRCVHMAAILGAASTGLLSVSPPQLTVGDCRQPLVGTGVFQLVDPKGFPRQLTSSPNSQSVLWCGRRRMESLNPHEFAVTKARYTGTWKPWARFWKG
jgi:hypothetical protein